MLKTATLHRVAKSPPLFLSKISERKAGLVDIDIETDLCSMQRTEVIPLHGIKMGQVNDNILITSFFFLLPSLRISGQIWQAKLGEKGSHRLP